MNGHNRKERQRHYIGNHAVFFSCSVSVSNIRKDLIEYESGMDVVGGADFCLSLETKVIAEMEGRCST